MEIGDIVQFKGVITRLMHEKNDFRIYACRPTKIISGTIKKHPVYGTATFVGFMPELTIDDVEYDITLQYEGEGQYGENWKYVSATRERPMTDTQIKNFLSEFTSSARASELVKVYPNIIDMITNGEEVDCSKLNGIGEKTFSKIKDKVISNLCLAQIHAEFSKYNCFTFTMIKKLYSKYKTVEATTYALKKEPYRALMELDGIGFKKADEIAKKILPNSQNSLQRMVAFVFFYISEIEKNGHTWVSIEDLYNEAVNIVEESIGHFKVALRDDYLWYDENTGRVARASTRDKEIYIAERLNQIHSCNSEWLDVDENAFTHVDGYPLTDEQMATLKSVKENGVTVLTAKAGAGKSFSIKAVCDMLDKYDKSYALATPTGKSSLVLKKYTERPCSTIHRFLKFDGEGFFFNEKRKIHLDVIILDEFSMTDIHLFFSLLKAIPNETRLLLVFDDKQLSSVGNGNLAHDLLSSNANCLNVCRLTKIFRYGNGLAIVANKIRDGEKYLDKVMQENEAKVIGETNDYTFIECIDYERIVSKVVNFYSKLIDEKGADINDICVITSKNKGSAGCGVINEAIQRLLQSKKETPCFKSDNHKYHVGDKIMQLVNNYGALVVTENKAYTKQEAENLNDDSCFNGMTGIVTHVFKDQIHVYFEEIDKTILYFEESLNSISLGFCCTVHKSQGSGYKYILLVTAKDATFMCNRNLIYTGVTRAKDKLIHIGSSATINASLRKEENKLRNTFLQEFLI